MIAKMKHNDALLTTFRYRRVRGEDHKQGIVGVSFYNYETEHQPPQSLETLCELQLPQEKQNMFLRNVFGISIQP